MDPKHLESIDPVEHVIEECAEVIHALQKGKRFGWDNIPPRFQSLPGAPTNRQIAIYEIRDVLQAINRLLPSLEGT